MVSASSDHGLCLRTSDLLREHHAVERHKGSGGNVPCILNISAEWMSAFSFMFHGVMGGGESCWHQLDMRLFGPGSSPDMVT
jgi:hypothetical protein